MYDIRVGTFDVDICQRNFNQREYASGSPARFKSWLGSKKKRKVDADFQAARAAKPVFRSVCTQ